MLIVTKQAVCYIFVITTDEQALVHTDAGLRHLEVNDDKLFIKVIIP